MGMLIEGRWTDEDRIIDDGAYVRSASAYDEPVSAECIAAIGSQPGRFHLIASHSCPWSHRTVLVRTLKGLADRVPLQVAGGSRRQGYPVNGGRPWRVPGLAHDIVHLHELYTLGDPHHTGRPTVPVLWDGQERRIVSNESARIMRAFDAVRGAGALDYTLVPQGLVESIDALNDKIYRGLSNAVYRAGFAERQDAYDEAVGQVFATLDELEAVLSERRYLFGNTITEADWRLFATLARFDVAYATHHGCTLRRLVDYRNLWAYARDLNRWRGVADTVQPELIHRASYENDARGRRPDVMPVRPVVDWLEPHGRERLGPAEVVLRSGRTQPIEPATMTPLRARRGARASAGEGYCLLLGSEKNRHRSLLGAARAGSDPVALLLLNGRVNTPRFADIVIPGSPDHAERALEAVERHRRATGLVPTSVVPLTELSLEPGLVIADRFGLPYLARDTVATARDKRRMKQAFVAAGLPAPRFAAFSSLDELRAVVREFEFPIVIKPRNAGGSEGVRMVAGEHELSAGFADLTRALQGYRDNYGQSETAFQVEEYIDAPHEVSVEVLNTRGGRHVIAVTDKCLGARPYFVELGHSVPSVWSRDRRITDTALAACEALNVDRGMAHVEMKIRDDGSPVLIEVNARPAGDGILDLVERVTGINPFELHCRSYLRDDVALPRPPIARGRAAIAFLKSEPGVVEDVMLPASTELPDHVVGLQVWIRPGQLARPCTDSNTRDGAVECYWPQDDAEAPLRAHLELARALSRRLIRLRAPASGAGGPALELDGTA